MCSRPASSRGKPAPTETAQLSKAALDLWERACPAKRPEQAYIHQASTTGNQTNESTVEHITRFATCSGSRLARTAIR
jgi:hypothetical protein